MIFIEVLRELGVIQGARKIGCRCPVPSHCARQTPIHCLLSWTLELLRVTLGLPPGLEMKQQVHLGCAQ